MILGWAGLWQKNTGSVMTENLNDMYDRKFDDRTVLLDYYPDLDDFTLRIDCMTLDQVSHFRDIFEKLSKTPDLTIDLVQMANVFPFKIKEFVLGVLPGNETTYRRLVFNAKDYRFYWRMNSSEWGTITGFIQGILDSKKPGHQYLDDHDDDAIIVFTYQERADSFRS